MIPNHPTEFVQHDPATRYVTPRPRLRRRGHADGATATLPIDRAGPVLCTG